MLCRTGHWLRLWPILIAPIERLAFCLLLGNQLRCELGLEFGWCFRQRGVALDQRLFEDRFMFGEKLDRDWCSARYS
jgi:hypothetical protein